MKLKNFEAIFFKLNKNNEIEKRKSSIIYYITKNNFPQFILINKENNLLEKI